MNYQLRFVRQFDKRDEQLFLALEQSFTDLERRTPGMAAGKRYVSIIGRKPTNTIRERCRTCQQPNQIKGRGAGNRPSDVLNHLNTELTYSLGAIPISRLNCRENAAGLE